MNAWKIPPGCHKPAAESFLNGGAPVPAELKTVGRWHVPGSAMGGSWWKEMTALRVLNTFKK